MPDWSIKIVPNPAATADAPATFVPDLIGSGPGTPLQARIDDDVSWNNTTDQAHWPWPTDAVGTLLPVSSGDPAYLSDPIPPNTPSDAYSFPKATTIYYCCKYHHGERGQIVVSAYAPVPPAPPPQN
jgi:hypothetical protein